MGALDRMKRAAQKESVRTGSEFSSLERMKQAAEKEKARTVVAPVYETPKPQNGYVSVADLNRETNGSGAQTSDAILRQAAADLAATLPQRREPSTTRTYWNGTTRQRQDRGAMLRAGMDKGYDTEGNITSGLQRAAAAISGIGADVLGRGKQDKAVYDLAAKALADEPAKSAKWQKRSDAAQERAIVSDALRGTQEELNRAASEGDYAARAGRALETVEKYGDNRYDDTVVGRWGANYGVGRLSQNSSYAWNEYLNSPTPENRRIAELYDAAIVNTQEQNADALSRDGTLRSWEASIANYAPQLLDQTKARLAGGALGLATGNVALGQAAGSAVDMYAITRGAAFKGLLDNGVPEDLAMTMAKDEALISSIIEYADSLGEYATLGGKEIVSLLLHGGADMAGTIAGKSAGKAAARKIAAYLGNIAQEYGEEFTQEAVSVANEQRLSNGTADSGKLGLASAAADVALRDGVFGEDPEIAARLREAGREGAKIATVFGAIQGGAGYAADRINSRYSTDAGMNALERASREVAESGTVSDGTAADILRNKPVSEAMQNTGAVTLTDDMTEQERRDAVKSAFAEEQAETPATPSQSAQDVAEQARQDNLTLATREVADAQETPLNGRNLSDEQITAELRNAAKLSSTLGRNGAAAFMTAYNADTADTISAGDAFGGFAKVYNAALNGKTIPDANIPDTLRIAAESSGKRDAQDAAQKQYFGENAGLSANRSMRPRNLSARDARILDAIGKATGVQIKFADHIGGVDERGTFSANAKIENGVLTIARDASDPIKAAFTHEVVHRLREVSPDSYRVLSQFIVDNMSNESFDSALREHIQRYGSDNISDMTEETVADAFGTVLDNPDLLERAVGIDRTFGQKLLDAVQEIVAKIKRALGASEARLSLEQVEAFRELQGKAEDMAKLLGDALDKVSAARENAATLATTPEEAEYSGIRFSRVTDKATLDRLENGETVKAYRAMQVIDGKLYPPMAAKVSSEAGGKRQLVEPTDMNVWYRSDERPDLVDPETGKFKLDKANGSTPLNVAYNPYFHTSATPLNDQFSSANKRPNLVTVEVEIPKSELTSGYKAQYAKDSVGETKWHAGPVASQLKGEKARRVFLSRWAKVIRIVPDAEVAKIVAKTLEGENIAVPYKVVTPSLRAELEKAGVSIDTTGEKTRYSRKTDADYMAAVERGDMDEAQQMVDEAAKAAGYNIEGYHGTDAHFNEFKLGDVGYHIGTKAQAKDRIAQAKERSTQANRNGHVMRLYGRLHNPLNAAFDFGDWHGKNVAGMLVETEQFEEGYDENAEEVNARLDEISRMPEGRYTDKVLREYLENLGYDGIVYDNQFEDIESDSDYSSGQSYILFNSNQLKLADPVTYDDNGNVIPLSERFNSGNNDIRYSRQYNRTATLEESTVDKYLADYASKSSPKYAQAYITWMSPRDFLNLTTTKLGRARIDSETTPLDVNNLGEATRYQPFFLRIDHKTGEIFGHEGRHRMNALLNAGVDRVPVLLFDSGNKYDKAPIEALALQGQEFENGKSNAVVTTTNLIPLNYENRDQIVREFSTQPAMERINEKYNKTQSVRFSLKRPVEETDRFIALHNMSAEAMRGALELGGMAMPSVAMVPSTTGHDTYGEISAVFRKESVSPTDRRNKIFSGDAYTPTFPEVGLKISERAADNADRKVEALLNQAGVRDDYSPSLDTDNLRDQIERFGSFEKAYGNKTYMKLAFLMDTGRKLTIPMQEKVYTNRADIATLRKVAQEIDLDAPYGGEGVMKYEPIIRRLVREYAVKKYGEKIADKLRPADKELYFNDVDSVIHAAKEYQWRKTEKQVDKAALEKRIENAMKTKAVRAEYSAWLNEMGKDMVEKRGIRNNRDYFTPSGNRRSFEQLYYDYSLANIVRAMQEEVQQGKKTFLTGSGNIRGAAAKSYGSIEEARKDIGRIRNMAQEEVLDEKIQAFDAKCRDLCIRMVEGRGHNKFGGAIDAAEVLTETLAKYKTADQIYRYWQREYRGSDYYDLSREIAEEAAELVKEAQNLPTSYLEAKLYRAVPLDEPIAYVVPRNIDKELLQQMRDAGLNVITYKPGDSADRLKKVNSVDGARFSRRRESGADQTEARLMQENDRLRAQIAHWKAQTKRTPEESVGKVSEKDVRKVAAALVDAYGSTVSATDIAPELQSLYDLMGTGRNEYGELSYDAAREIANSVARKIAENAIDDTESAYGNYADLRKFLRETPITVSQSDTVEVDNWGDWRKRNMGRLNVRRGDTSNIDVIYDELSDRWPEFFPGDVISVGDQLNRMADVMDFIYNDRGHNPFDPYMDQAIIDIGNDVMERFFDIPQAKTFADRMIERQKRAASEKKEAVDRAFLAGQMSQGAKMAEQMRTRETRQEERLRRVRETLQKSIERRDERLERQAERFRAKTEEGREKQSAARLRKMITRHTAELSRRLLAPTDKKHIPDALRNPVAAMLEAINKESAYETVYDENGKRRRVKPGSGEVTKRTQAFRALKEQYANAQKEGNGELVIDPDLFGDESEGFQGLFDRVIAMSDTPIQSMNTEQLETVWRVVRAVEHSIRNYGKTLAATKYKTTEDWARRFFSDTQKRRERSSSIAANLALDLENPYTFFSQFGQSGKDIYRMLRDAQDRQRVRLDEIGDDVKAIVDEKTVDKWRRERHDITTERGENLTLTTGQLMEIYNLSKREKAQDHLMRGGIVQPEIKRDGKLPKIERGADVVRLTAGDLERLAGMLTQEQREVAASLQQLTADKLAAWGNEASMRAYGYSKFTERNYWPIHSAKEALHSNVEKNSGNVRSIKNIGMAKAVVPHASNGLTIGDVFDTFAEHTADMVDYATWLLPMEDASRLYNFKYKGEDKDTFFKQQLDRVGGRNGKAQRYWENLMANIQNGISHGGRTDFERLASGAVGKVKGASVGANVRVIVQQPTAFLRANAVMNPASLTRGLIGGVTGGNGWQKALQYAPIAQIKDAGGFDQGNMRSVNAELFGDTNALTKINELAGKGAQAADAVTWGRLWNAAEWETKRLNPSVEAGSAEFYRKTAELFTDVIDQSQVVDGVLQRSAIMRSADGLTQQATSFMGEPIMSLNMLIRSLDAARYETDQKRRSAAIKQFGRVVVALAVTDIVNSAVQSLVDAYRDDDRDKDYWERFAEKLTGIVGDEQSAADVLKNVYFGGNLAENMSIVRRIPYAKDAVSMWQGFTVKRMDTQAVNDLMTAVKQLGSKKWSTGYGALRVAEQAAKIVGIPAAAIERDALGAARSIVYASDDPVAIYKFDKSIYNPSTNKSRFYQSLFLALEQGNVEDYNYLREDLTAAANVSAKDVDDAMKSLYSKKVKANETYTLPQESADLLGIRQKYAAKEDNNEEKFSAESLPAADYTRYTNQRAASYKEFRDALTGTAEFKALSGEDKDRALNMAYNLANEYALEANSNGAYQVTTKWMQYARDAERYGIGADEYLLFHMVYETTSGGKDKNGKDIKGQTKSDKVRAWLGKQRDLTIGQKEWLWSTVYQSAYNK